MIPAESNRPEMDNLSFFGQSYNYFRKWVVFFFRDLVQVLTLFGFWVISSELFLQAFCRLTRGFCST